MARNAQMKRIVLVGPRAGLNGALVSGVEFVDGVYEAKPKGEDDLINMLATYHNAHEEGTPDYNAAVKEWDENPLSPAGKKRAAEEAAKAKADEAAKATAEAAAQAKAIADAAKALVEGKPTAKTELKPANAK